MSFRHSNGLIKAFREARKAEAAMKTVAGVVVNGRSRGCTVRYTGCGRVEHISFDEAATGFKDENGRVDPKRVAQAVKEAMLDAQQQVASVKQAEWNEVNHRKVTEYATCPDLLKPLPHHHFRYQPAQEALMDFPHKLSSPEVELGAGLREALEKREALKMVYEGAFWSGGELIDKQLEKHAARDAGMA